jgi:NADH dehydrogenase FAD-containing subunit
MHRILIVGGGAAGLELATRLGDRFGKRGRAQVELLDRSRTHLWKRRAQTQSEPLRPEQLHIAIVGAGATGVELAAELRNTTRDLVAYGLDHIDAQRDI